MRVYPRVGEHNMEQEIRASVERIVERYEHAQAEIFWLGFFFGMSSFGLAVMMLFRP